MSVRDAVFPLVPRRRLHGARLRDDAGWAPRRGQRRRRLAPVRPRRRHATRSTGAASARLSAARGTDEFIVREHFADDAPRVVMVVDRRPEMALSSPDVPWLRKDEALRVAATHVADSVAEARGLVGYLDFAEGEEAPFWRPPASSREPWSIRERHLQHPAYRAPEDNLDAGARVPRGPPPLDSGRELPLRALGLPRLAGARDLGAGRRASLGRRPDRGAGPDLGAELPGGRRHRRATRRRRRPCAPRPPARRRVGGAPRRRTSRGGTHCSTSSPGSASSPCSSRRPIASTCSPRCSSGRRTASSSTDGAGDEAARSSSWPASPAARSSGSGSASCSTRDGRRWRRASAPRASVFVASADRHADRGALRRARRRRPRRRREQGARRPGHGSRAVRTSRPTLRPAQRTVERFENASSVRLRYRFTLRCLDEECAPEGERKLIELPGTGVFYRFRSAPGQGTAIVDWPPFEVTRARAGRGARAGALARRRHLAPRCDLRALAAARSPRFLVAGSILLALLAVWLVWRLARPQAAVVVDEVEAEETPGERPRACAPARSRGVARRRLARAAEGVRTRRPGARLARARRARRPGAGPRVEPGRAEPRRRGRARARGARGDERRPGDDRRRSAGRAYRRPRRASS